MLRTPALAQLLLGRLLALGSMTEIEALDALEAGAPRRSREVIAWAQQAGMVRRVAGTDEQPATIEALCLPRSLAS